MQLNRSISNLRAADTIMSRLNLVHGNLSKVLLHMRLKQLRQGQTCLAAEWYDVRLVVALVKQGSALLARGWVTARLISRWHLSGLVAVASNACEVTLWISMDEV